MSASSEAPLRCVLAARDAGSKAAVRQWKRSHKCQFSGLR